LAAVHFLKVGSFNPLWDKQRTAQESRGPAGSTASMLTSVSAVSNLAI